MLLDKNLALLGFKRMLGKNLPLSEIVHDQAITSISLGQLGTVGDLHIDTIVMAWTAMAVVLVGCASVSSRLVVQGAGGAGQAVLEGLYTFIAGLAKGAIGDHRYKTYVPLLCALFTFILASNLIGIMPFPVLEHMSWWPHMHGEHFELAAATTDFNCTAGLAAVSILTYVFSGIAVHGFEYIKLFCLKPIAPIEWLDIVVRPATLALRLLLVITADEMLRGAFLKICPVLIPTAVMGFEVFIALVQAFVFTLLTSIYIGTAVAEHH